MASLTEAPDRVNAELRRHLRLVERAERLQFDEFQEEHVAEVVGKRLAKPVQDLLLALRQIIITERSFGVDKARAYDSIIGPLHELHAACIDQWEDK